MTEHSYRDLNKNGRMDPYEDSRLPVEARVTDLLGQMTLEEKAGLFFHPMIGMNPDGSLQDGMGGFGPIFTTRMVAEQKINHFNVLAVAPPAPMAAWHNRLQRLAESTRLGIPATISSDPRHAFSHNPGAALMAGHFSQWPEPIGLAAIGDEALTAAFGDMARQEYLAVGIRVALHPMADLATEPRWARINGTFGEDAALSARLTAAYIRGFQGQGIGPHSVACMTKHFPGGGPQMDGEDAHFSIGKEQVYPGNNFDYHLLPFEAAFAAGTSQIMPYYGMPIGTQHEAVGFGFNRGIITGLLREKYGFDGIVCTDWRLLTDARLPDGSVMVEAKCWGVEHLSLAERVKKVLEAGVDQFGGEACPEVIVELVTSGQIGEDRIDQSVRRLLREKFRLGLFDNPFVDEGRAVEIVGNAEFQAAGELAQRKSIVLLKNGSGDAPVLPLSGRPKLYVEGVSPEIAARFGEVVESPGAADFAILRLPAPFEPREGFLERFFHSGDLDFKEPELSRVLEILGKAPTIVDIYLERPAVIPEIAAQSVALLGNFGASDAALLDILFGHSAPTGRLPFELPSSMEAVRGQKEDTPFDSENPLYPFGFGLGYENT
ncbi:MAG: glycoside hydrolase family 3 C-terminal domain-containing protein [Caldilineaceae bacterium]|nr:glycoside hydrolase family 3 C-terminal domain-containing protein [Caldilineaceae bacterium]